MSEQPTHTPGPWWAGGQATGDWLIQSGDPNTYAAPWAVTAGTLGAIRGGEKAEANAHLIAAAPDYHAAAQAIEAHSAVSAASDNIILIPRADYDALLAAHAKASLWVCFMTQGGR